jgi:hypothetical protein
MARGADGSMLTKEQLDQLNLDRYNQAIADGNLYNIGPIVDGGGTSFSPERWDDYFNKNPDVKPKDYTNQKDIQAKLDSGETIDTDSQEFVVERDDVEVISEEDMPPSYPKRGKDNSFMTEEQAQSEISKDVTDEIKTQATVEAEQDVDDEFDSPVSEWIKEFSSMEDEEFNSVKMAIEQLPANAQEAYATVAEKRETEVTDKAFAEDIAKDDAEIARLDKEIQAYTDSDIELDEDAGGMLTSKSMPDSSKTDMMKTVMADYGLDDAQSTEMLGKLKGLCN